MNKFPELDARSLSIIKYLVEEYMRSGTPIASATLASKQGVNLSPASVRNVMAKLEDFGLIQQVHTSSGRLPTSQGVRIYLSTLLRLQPPSQKVQNQLQKKINTSAIHTMAKSAIESVADLTQMVALVTVPNANQAQIAQIHFVPLAPNRLIAVLVGLTGEVSNRIIELQSPVTKRDLELAEQFFNANFSGKSMFEARSDLASRVVSLKKSVAKLLKKMVDSASEGNSQPPSLLTHGSENLVAHAALLDGSQQLPKMLGVLSRKERLLQLLSLGIDSDDVSVFIGAESGIPELDNASFVMSNYEDENGNVIGALGLIGPMRMEYSQVLPIIDMTSTLMGKAIAQMHHHNKQN